MLVQLALENVVNPKQADVVRQLMERGLLVRDPTLRLFNRSFALFIRDVQNPDMVVEWEQHTSSFSWARTRWILIAFLMIGLLFLWTTQRDLFNTGIAFLTAAAVGLPGALKLITSLKSTGKES